MAHLETPLLKRIFFFSLLFPALLKAQYTDIINSNRPGVSVSAYAVGKNVIQGEWGFSYESQEHNLLNTETDILETDLGLRYGLLFETLELHYEGTFSNHDVYNTGFDTATTLRNFTQNRLGLKWLLFDPFKDPDRNKPNLYSWKANNRFQLRDLVPAISVYGGVNYIFGDNPFFPNDPALSYRGMIATQSKLGRRLVLITNIAYDRITTDDPELSYVISLSHALANPKWSIFIENQGIDSDRYTDSLLRGGIAHLFSENFQADLLLGASMKNTPSRLFGSLGISYRLDFHKDQPVSIQDQQGGKNGKRIGRKANRKKRKGKGAEDLIIDL